MVSNGDALRDHVEEGHRKVTGGQPNQSAGAAAPRHGHALLECAERRCSDQDPVRATTGHLLDGSGWVAHLGIDDGVGA